MPSIHFLDVTNRDGVQTARTGLSKFGKVMVNFYLGRLGVAQSEIGFPFLFHEVPYVRACLALAEAGAFGDLRLSGWCRAVPADVEAAVAVQAAGTGLRHYNLSISTSDQMIAHKFRSKLDRAAIIEEMTASVAVARAAGAGRAGGAPGEFSIGVNAEDGSTALLADIPGAIRDAGDIPRPPVRASRPPLARAAVKAGSCLIIAAAAVWVAAIAVPSGAGPYPDHPFLLPMLLLATIAVVAAPCILGHGVVTSWKLRRSRGQVPPRPGPGGHALEGERSASTGQDPDPPRIRTDQTHADLRAHKSRQGRPHIPAQPGRTPRGVRLAPGAV